MENSTPAGQDSTVGGVRTANQQGGAVVGSGRGNNATTVRVAAQQNQLSLNLGSNTNTTSKPAPPQFDPPQRQQPLASQQQNKQNSLMNNQGQLQAGGVQNMNNARQQQQQGGVMNANAQSLLQSLLQNHLKMGNAVNTLTQQQEVLNQGGEGDNKIQQTHHDFVQAYYLQSVLIQQLLTQQENFSNVNDPINPEQQERQQRFNNQQNNP
ncbi:unnamed protein product, partial [Amoebophrya sp. A120]|eukprot:GSA120T00025850001.1